MLRHAQDSHRQVPSLRHKRNWNGQRQLRAGTPPHRLDTKNVVL